MPTRLPPSWRPVLGDQLRQPYFQKLTEFLERERREYDVYPPEPDVFNALKFTPYDRVKVVILGQDPYHDAGQAHGLAFSVRPGVTPPPSLRNIFKELQVDVGCPKPANGDLEPWTKQGVLLLNTVLTVRAHQPGSHRGKGWE
ncbi:MAG TPA: uracil-DNA glycosylase, partial [Gemmataceae bacterium]|nr:uracil-DNA glycosylase [Gemmataceae bacterium]